MPKALIYCRVSTEEQAESGHSLETQEKTCRQFALHNGYQVMAVYRDEGKSGTNLERPGIKALLALVQENNSVDAVIVQETDRLARNTKDHLTIRALLQKAAIKLISVAQPMLDDSPEGNMIDTIIASVNQFQSDINSRKIKKGVQEKFDSGWWPGWAPLGYLNKSSRNDHKTIIPDPSSWHLVRRGLKMYLTGNYSAIEVADFLFRKGVKSKTGKKICNSIMTNMLRNPFYAGIMNWNGQNKLGKHKPMITLQEHKEIIFVIEAHAFHSCRRRKHAFLLKGFAFCNICGHRYTAEKHPAKNVEYYHCTCSGQDGRNILHSNMGQNIRVSDLEYQVEEYFKEIQFGEGFINLVVGKLKNLYAQKKALSEIEKRILLNQQLAAERKRDIAEEKLLNRVIADKDFVRIKAKIDISLGHIQDRLDILEHEHEFDVEVIREILNLAQNIYETYKKAPYELKRHFLGLFWDQFMVQDKTIISAIPNKLVRVLCENKQVIINDQMSRGQESNLHKTVLQTAA